MPPTRARLLLPPICSWLGLAALLLGGLMGLATNAEAADGAPVWVNRYGTRFFLAKATADAPAAIAVDSAGNVFVTGRSLGTFGYGVYQNGYTDYLTIKYLSDGTPIWTNRYHGPGVDADLANALAVDSAGNVYVTGASYGTNSSYDYVTIKYLSDGTPAWTNRYDGPGNSGDFAYALAVDSTGNVYVTGASFGTGSYPDYATIKYRTDGTPVWTNRYDGPLKRNDSAKALAIDSAGNVYVTGSSFGSYYEDYATIKYLSDGTPAWTNRYNGPGNDSDSARSLAVDSAGKVYVTGNSIGTNRYYSDYATIKYLSDGTPAWTNRYDGPGNSGDFAYALALDNAGNVYVTGLSVGGNVTIKYRADGTSAWTIAVTGAKHSL